ncbi:MAG: zinc transport system ATP-binding protein, partial [Parcubacteria group bacterium Athens0714_26]
MSTILETKNVSVHYGQTEAVSDVSFKIEKGDFIGLVGPNGAGKTTLAKAILGLMPLSSGKVSLFGQPQKTFQDYYKIG